MRRCYFAYTWEDEKIHTLLEYLKDKIVTFSEGSVEVIYDKDSFRPGEDYEKREEMILSSDCIIVFFSPEYKRIVDEQDENRGTYREYKKIEEMKNRNVAAIVPVIIEGNERNAITKEFKRNIAYALKISEILTKSKEKKIKEKYINTTNNLVRKILKETELAYKKRDYEFETKDEMIEALFGESEANQKLPQKCMCKTDAYQRVMNQSRRYIIGRKGSGKSTFFELLEKYDVNAFEKKYKVLRPIKADKINMEYVYSILTSYRYDDKLFPIHERLELFWEIYTYLCAIYIVCLEEENFKIEDEERRIIFRRTGEILKRHKFGSEKLDTEKCHEALFVSAIDAFENFFDSQIVDYGCAESFQASLVANFNVDNVMNIYFGKHLYSDLKEAILKCTKKMLIALDGFDNVSDMFRKRTKYLLKKDNALENLDGEKRLEFEDLFFSSMFNVFERIRKADRGIMNKVSFCIIIPQDKIDQIKKHDRDFSKYNFASLSWDAIDLLQMLVFRLEYVYANRKEDNSGIENLQERFEHIMKKHFSSIPLRIQTKVGDKNTSMDLFKYLLRLSFWRPRDIIKYFYELYLANKNCKRGEELSSEIVKSILYEKANNIIETEFYAEYRNVITNLEEIMDEFKRKNIVMEVQEIYEILSKQPFETIALRKFSDPTNKFKMLYELGAFGIIVDRTIRASENIECEICFNYNEGLEPLKLLKNAYYIENGLVKGIINPIFTRRLSLIYNINSVIEDYEWKYLYDNHTRKSSIRRI